MNIIMRTMLIVSVTGACFAANDVQLEQRVEQLEKELADLKASLAPVIKKQQLQQRVEEWRHTARKRMRKDSELYSNDELREIESLYQVANKKWRTQEGKDSLKILIDKYPLANRTGCAILYLGQMTQGDVREDYLKKAIEGHSDCFYGDGVQVGAYARYYLAKHYDGQGETSEAKKLYAEIRSDYPDAIDHKGKPLSLYISK